MNTQNQNNEQTQADPAEFHRMMNDISFLKKAMETQLETIKPNKLTDMLASLFCAEFFLVFGALALLLFQKISWWLIIPILLFSYVVWVSGVTCVVYKLRVEDYKKFLVANNMKIDNI